MYKIERKSFGVKLTFGGIIQPEEMKQWVEDSKPVIAKTTSGFGAFIDMRTLKPLADKTKAQMEVGQKLYKAAGMTRSVVILDSHITTLQFKQIAKETGIYEWERYVNASASSDWEAIGLAWINKGIDPDK